jgi:uncharacterized membrane protein (DUF485 family)
MATIPYGDVPAAPKQATAAPAAAPAAQPWDELAASPEFQALLRAKRSFLIPATVFFIVYYFALPILVGYFPGFMSTNVIGNINLAYLFALSQFIMAWVMAWVYVREATNVFDPLAQSVLRRVRGGKGSK